jgi:2-iminobutanoate/2-iminopropanoate deaminase
MKPRAISYAALVFVYVTSVATRADRNYMVLKRPAGMSALPFSDGVQVGDVLYIAGHIGRDPKTGKPGASADEEARLAMDGIKQTLEAAGMSMDDIVSIQVFCSDLSL